MREKPDLKIGDTVAYTDVNLWNYRGTVINLNKGERGGDCHVEWFRPTRVKTEEWSPNLKKLKGGKQ